LLQVLVKDAKEGHSFVQTKSHLFANIRSQSRPRTCSYGSARSQLIGRCGLSPLIHDSYDQPIFPLSSRGLECSNLGKKLIMISFCAVLTCNGTGWLNGRASDSSERISRRLGVQFPPRSCQPFFSTLKSADIVLNKQLTLLRVPLMSIGLIGSRRASTNRFEAVQCDPKARIGKFPCEAMSLRDEEMAIETSQSKSKAVLQPERISGQIP
jgi:hypothetical protein